MGCLSGRIKNNTQKVKASLKYINTGRLNIKLGLICSTEALDEIFICTDDVFILIDGRTFNVLK